METVSSTIGILNQVCSALSMFLNVMPLSSIVVDEYCGDGNGNKISLYDHNEMKCDGTDTRILEIDSECLLAKKMNIYFQDLTTFQLAI